MQKDLIYTKVPKKLWDKPLVIHATFDGYFPQTNELDKLNWTADLLYLVEAETGFRLADSLTVPYGKNIESADLQKGERFMFTANLKRRGKFLEIYKLERIRKVQPFGAKSYAG
jgi:hypothetical protein